MTELATPSDYHKEYLPGYTGHVPSKNERFGATAGQIKREILEDAGKHPIMLNAMREADETGRLYSSNFVPAIDKNKIVFGNMSRYASIVPYRLLSSSGLSDVVLTLSGP